MAPCVAGMFESIAIRQLWPIGPAVISAADVLVKIADAPPVFTFEGQT